MLERRRAAELLRPRHRRSRARSTARACTWARPTRTGPSTSAPTRRRGSPIGDNSERVLIEHNVFENITAEGADLKEGTDSGTLRDNVFRHAGDLGAQQRGLRGRRQGRQLADRGQHRLRHERVLGARRRDAVRASSTTGSRATRSTTGTGITTSSAPTGWTARSPGSGSGSTRSSGTRSRATTSRRAPPRASSATTASRPPVRADRRGRRDRPSPWFWVKWGDRNVR